MAKYACVDVGGTFTDAAILDEGGSVHIFKAPTTPPDYEKGILGALQNAADFYDVPLRTLLEEVSVERGGRLTHGSTIATNAILEKKAGKTGMITTKGHRDVLLFREGPKKNPHDLYLRYPEPFVPRYLTMPVAERISAEGEILVPLDEAELRAAALQLKAYDVEAIAVCFLWSTVNPEHEQRARACIKEVWPEAVVVLSSEVNPQISEYRRFVSAAMDASLRKLVSTYTRKLNETLNEAGYIGELNLLNAFGGIMRPAEIAACPLYSIDSGPSMAPIAGRSFAWEDLGERDAVVLDMGGTTFDVSCVVDGQIAVSRNTAVGDEIPGIARVGVHSIGAGGGSIAWIDAGGMLKVGPQSAGSVPGPACYGRGGDMPTVTDANLVLGYLNPYYFNDGKLSLCVEKAAAAIETHVAKPLGIGLYEAAAAIWGTVNANMVKAIKDVTVWQGVDPRGYAMIAGGGACGIHAIALAEGLEMKSTLIPKAAGGLSAAGGLFSDMVTEFSFAQYTETHNFQYAAADAEVKRLYEQAQAFFARNQILPQDRRVELYMEGRYPYQAWNLTVLACEDMDASFRFTPDFVKELEERFHVEHERQFCVRDESHVNIFGWRLRATGKSARSIKLHGGGTEPESGKPEPKNMRSMFFHGYDAPRETPVYDGLKLRWGQSVQGPAVIEEPTTTIAVLPGYSASVTRIGNYFVKIND